MISQRIKDARKAKKLTQEELALKVQTTKGTISNYENEYSTPSNEMIVLLADVLDVTADYLLGRTDFPDYSQTQQQEFERFKDNPELQRFFYELPKSPEEDLKALKVMWDFIQSQKK
ncbi:helix-turn-helix transcriptional regulator [Viridibacillus arvi]|uniref:helix-turn-helix domain-containing protein n=1 Tax=Viridibacillus TaxID=496496 RepID=UPI00096FBA03|nr:helix-turn-helix transcriptional regulator [Viridibacillus sp. FSL H7-0596]OMC86887.1 hypothetical protein BK128_09480 [Viridibacillus sp. FSL H7-0596]